MLCMCACPLVYAYTGKHRVVLFTVVKKMYMYTCTVGALKMYIHVHVYSFYLEVNYFFPISKRLY